MATPISYEALERVKEVFKKDESTNQNSSGTGSDQGRFLVGAYLEHYGIQYRIKNNGPGTLFLLNQCLFDPSHIKGEAAIAQAGSGTLSYKCFHDSCQGKTWKEARERISGTDSLRQFCSFPRSKKSGDSDVSAVIPEKKFSELDFLPAILFPFGVFPNRLQQFFFDCAEALHVEPVIVAGVSLPIMAGVIGNKIRISPKRGWSEPGFEWMGIIEPTGGGKSPVINTLMAPIFQIQDELWEEFQAQLKAWKEAKMKKTAEKNKDKNPVHPSETPPPVLRHIFSSDSTIEALAHIFSGDGHGLILHRDELAGFICGMNQYKKGAGDDRQKYLQLFDCQPFKVDRVIGTLWVKKCGASIIGGIQPRLLPQIFDETAFADGLFPRFLMIYQDRQVNTFSPKTLDKENETFWDRLIRRCFIAPWGPLKPPQVLILSDEARNMWASFYNELHAISPFLSENARGFIPKLIGYSLRLIGQIHIIEGVIGISQKELKPGESPWRPIIQAETAEKGIQLTRFFAGQMSTVLSIYGKKEKKLDGQEIRLIQVLYQLHEKVKNGRLPLSDIRIAYNDGIPAIARLPEDNKILSGLIRALSLETKKSTGGYSHLIWDQGKIEKIFRKNLTNVTNATPIPPYSNDNDVSGEIFPDEKTQEGTIQPLDLTEAEVID